MDFGIVAVHIYFGGLESRARGESAGVGELHRNGFGQWVDGAGAAGGDRVGVCGGGRGLAGAGGIQLDAAAHAGQESDWRGFGKVCVV
jgi:hypothetical protein